MKFQLTSPCGNCPFRTDIRPFLHPARAQQIADYALVTEKTFACHKTIKHDDDGNGLHSPDDQQCAGALILAEKNGGVAQNLMFRLAWKLGFLNPDKLNLEAPVYNTAAEMVEAHRKAEERG